MQLWTDFYMDNNSKHISEQDFVSLISLNQRRILAYVIMLIPNRSDAEDILQETIAVMWEKKSEFVSGTDFVAWGIRIANFKILNYRKKAVKTCQMIINDKQFNRFEKQAVERSGCAEEMLFKLDQCLKKISEPDRQLLSMKYSKNKSVKEISSRINKSIRSVYLNLSRIHGLLLECIERSRV